MRFKKRWVKVDYTNKLNRWYKFIDKSMDRLKNYKLDLNNDLEITDIFIEDLITIDKICKAKEGLTIF